MTDTIRIQDIGPIETLTIPITPGITVLRGESETGKSLALEAVSRLLGGDGEVTCRDDAASGVVEGLGARISVRQTARRTGELVAVALDGDLNISDLVSPPIKDPATADRHRIKSLLRLTGAEANAELFRALCPDDASFDAACTADVLKCDDLVEMAAKIKRNLEAASRRADDAAEKEEGFALGCQSAGEGIDLTIETDSENLQKVLESAISDRAAINATAASAEDVLSKAADAKRLINSTPSPQVNRLSSLVDDSIAFRDRLTAVVEEQRKSLRDNEEALRAAQEAVVSRNNELTAAEQHLASIEEWRKTVEAAENVEQPGLEKIAKCEESVSLARANIEQAALVRQAKAKLGEARKHREAAGVCRALADVLRNGAKGTDDILSQAVASKHLFVKRGRLLTNQPERGEVFYADRSDGMRYKIALDEAVMRIRQRGAEKTAVITLPGAAFSEMSPKLRLEVSGYAKELGVCILAIQTTDGDIRAELFDKEAGVPNGK